VKIAQSFNVFNLIITIGTEKKGIKKKIGDVSEIKTLDAHPTPKD
jgi:hypothetical protein